MEITQIRKELEEKVKKIDPIGKRLKFNLDGEIILIDGSNDPNVVTDNDDMADSIRALRNHGSRAPYKHSIVGYNSRLDELQACILRIKLKYIDKLTKKRREVAQAD